MKLSVAANWQDDLLDALAPYSVTELFGSLRQTPSGGGRPSMILPEVGIVAAKDHIRKAAARGIGFNYLLNGMCVGTATGKDLERGVRDHLAPLVDAGITVVTVSHPFVLALVKKYFSSLRVKISILPGLDTPAKIKAFEDLGADEIALSIMANRDFDFLEKVKQVARCELTLLVNQACLYMCSERLYHGGVNAHASSTLGVDPGFAGNYSLIKCSLQKLTKQVHLIKSRWIRPEDLSTYEAVGYETFKIAGREMGTPWLANAVRAYNNRHFDGNLSEILNGIAVTMSAGGPETRALPFIDNRVLDGFLDHFVKGRCRRHCVGCNYCEIVAKKTVDLFPEKNARFVETLKMIAASIIE